MKENGNFVEAVFDAVRRHEVPVFYEADGWRRCAACANAAKLNEASVEQVRNYEMSVCCDDCGCSLPSLDTPFGEG